MHLVQTYSLKAGLKKFGDCGHSAAISEMKQLHDCTVFQPFMVEDLTPVEQKRALETLIFLTEKHDRQIKGCTCADGSTQHAYTNCDRAASPTVFTESILITGVIDAKEKRDVMMADIPNAFVQTEIGEKPIGE